MIQIKCNLSVLVAVRSTYMGVDREKEKENMLKNKNNSNNPKNILDTINPILCLKSACDLLLECDLLIKKEVAQRHISPYYTYKEVYGRMKSVPTSRCTDTYSPYDLLTLPQLLLSHVRCVVRTENSIILYYVTFHSFIPLDSLSISLFLSLFCLFSLSL